jgi:hypothetical protein
MAPTGSLIGQAQHQATVQRQTVASEVMNFSDVLANRAGNLVSLMDSKLCVISRPCGPASDGNCTKDSEYPPYFGGLRDNFQRISSSLDAMEEILSRVEL